MSENHDLTGVRRLYPWLSDTYPLEGLADAVPPSIDATEADRFVDINPDKIRYLAFEGGGPKGLVYPGAIQALEEIAGKNGNPVLTYRTRGDARIGIRGEEDGGQIVGISGASAGALTAVMLSVGWGADQLRTFMVGDEGANIEAFNFNRLQNLPSGGKCVPRLGGCTAPENGFDARLSIIGALLATFENYTIMSSFAAPVARAVYNNLFACTSLSADTDGAIKVISCRHAYAQDVLRNFGLFSGCAARSLLDRLIAEQAARAEGVSSPLKYRNLSFAEHRRIFRVALAITGTNLSRRKSVVFSPDTTPNVPVADAARISISLPVAFMPVQVDSRAAQKYGNQNPRERQLSNEELMGVRVDGGLLNNIPIRALDPTNRQTLAFRLNPGDDDVADIDSLPDFVWAYINLVKFGTGESHIVGELERRTILLDTGQLGTFNFNVDAKAVAPLLTKPETRSGQASTSKAKGAFKSQRQKTWRPNPPPAFVWSNLMPFPVKDAQAADR